MYDWLKLNAVPAVSCVAAIVPGAYTPAVIVPADTVPAVEPSVVSILLPEIEKVEPILEASVLAASTVNCTLDVCELTIPPAYAEDPIPSNNNKGKNFFMIETIYLSGI